jgi:RNA polymerase sigma-70 factor (ECF subfamily)
MVLKTDSDLEVYLAFKAGNLAALGIIYDRYGEVVYKLSLKILGNEAEAQDLTQDVFLFFWHNANYNPQRGSILVFLMVITRSRAINRLNQKRSQERLTQRWHQSNPFDYSNRPLEKVVRSEICQQVSEALQKLPAPQKEVLEMAYYQNLSQSEITQQLNIPLGTVKTRSRQGLIKLRQLLQDTLD